MLHFGKYFTISLFFINCAYAQTQAQLIDLYLDKIKHNDQQLTQFLYAMPKGGDLHVHASGATYAENMLKYAAKSNLCLDQTFTIYTTKKCSSKKKLQYIVNKGSLREALVKAWSMKDFNFKNTLGHDHFFAAFSKFYPITSRYKHKIYSEIVQRAGEQNELYLELMVTPEKDLATDLGAKVGWNPNFDILRQALLHAGMKSILKKVSMSLDNDEAYRYKTLACGTEVPKAGCQVMVNYLYTVNREQSPAKVFAQMLLGFELAENDSRLVGINIAAAEDGKLASRDYSLHMQMLHYLHSIYSHVHISLHAGELTPKIASRQDLRFHIRQAVELGAAERIGHGVDIPYEQGTEQLLQRLAQQKVLIEINLSSNANILGIKGSNHPLHLYMAHKVPVALATDDEGINRSNLTLEFKRAIQEHHLNYSMLKQMVRNSLQYSFLSGRPIWENDNYVNFIKPCREEKKIEMPKSAGRACQRFLDLNQKAAMQWQLEKKFAQFERQILNDVKI